MTSSSIFLADVKHIVVVVVILCYNCSYYAQAQTTFGEQQIINANAVGARCVHAADLDNDGDIDVLSASDGDNKIAWYENNGANNFSAEQIITANAPSAKFVYATDLDGDGDNDIVSTIGEIYNEISWYENDGNGSFGNKQVIDYFEGSANTYIVDWDNDGDADIVAGIFIILPSNTLDNVVWYENNGNADFSSQQFIFSTTNGGVFLDVTDLDNDGILDLISASVGDNTLVWYKQDNQGNLEIPQTISTNANDPTFVYTVDLDNDGDMDIILASDANNTIVYYKNNGADNFEELQTITDSVFFVTRIYAADLDNDGDFDVLSASLYDDKIAWYQNDGNGNFGSQQIITTNAYAATSVYATDLDNDNDIDILSASAGDAKIAWYQNFLNDTKIKGRVFYDLNQNGLFDTNEIALDDQATNLQPINLTAYSNTNGLFEYGIGAEGGTYQVNYTPPINWHATTPTQYNITLDAGETMADNNFGIYPDVFNVDVKPYVASGINRCNSVVSYTLIYANEGTSFTDGIVRFTPDEQMTYVSANPIPDSTSANGTLYWHFDNLPPYQQQQINMSWQMPDGNATGDTLSSIAVVDFASADGTNASSNGFGYRPVVLCSFDPNDKQVTPAGIGNANYTLMNEELIYTIRFQNTGNDTAFTVVVRDTLALNLDWNTFRPITSSHPMEVLRYNNGLVTFTFNNINLLDSTANEAASHGFIMYAIRPQTNLPDATNIANTAYIYFDQNEAVVTNTTQNMLVYELPTEGALPIELALFKGTVQEKNNLLQWQTFTEINNNYFTLQRSTDGKSFTNIATINGAGNSNYIRNYQFVDTKPKQGINYYRLLSTDFDGKIHQSHVIALNNTFNTTFTLFPNPAHNQITISFNTPITLPIRTTLYSVSGKKMATYNNAAGSQTITIARQNLPKGLYFVQVQDVNSGQILGNSKITFD